MSETAPDLFAVLPPGLFRPLGDPYARVYFGMLAALYAAKFEGAPVELPRGVAMAIAEDVLRSSSEWSEKRDDLMASVADEDLSDEDARAEDDEACRATAARLLRRLERTGWFRFEYYPEVGEALNFHAYPARLVGLLRSIAKDERWTSPRIARELNSRCPRPLMLILGNSDPWIMRAWRHYPGRWWDRVRAMRIERCC